MKNLNLPFALRQPLLHWGVFGILAFVYFWLLFYPNHFSYPIQGDCVLTLSRNDFGHGYGYLQKYALRAYLENSLHILHDLCGRDLASVNALCTAIYFAACTIVFGTLRQLYGFGPALLGASLFCVYSSKYEVFFIFSGSFYHINILIAAVVLWLGVRAKATLGISLLISTLIFISSHWYENLIVMAPFFAMVWIGEYLAARQRPPLRTWVACALPFLASFLIFFLRSSLGKNSIIRGDVGPSSSFYGLSLVGKLRLGITQTMDATIGSRHADQSMHAIRSFFNNLTAETPNLPWVVFAVGAALVLIVIYSTRPKQATTQDTVSAYRPLIVGLAALVMFIISGTTTIAINGTFAPSRLTYLPSLFLATAATALIWSIFNFLPRRVDERSQRFIRAAIALPFAMIVCFELMAFSALSRSAGDSARFDAKISNDMIKILPKPLPPQAHFFFFLQMPESARNGYFWAFPCNYESRPMVPLWYGFQSDVIPTLTTSMRIESLTARTALLDFTQPPLQSIRAMELAKLFDQNFAITGGTATPVLAAEDPNLLRMDNSFVMLGEIKKGLGDVTDGGHVWRTNPITVTDDGDQAIGEVNFPLVIVPSLQEHSIELLLQPLTESAACVHLRLINTANQALFDVWFDTITGTVKHTAGAGARSSREGGQWQLVLPFKNVSGGQDLMFHLAPAAGSILGQPDQTLKGGVILSRVTVHSISPFMPFVFDENFHPRFIESITFTADGNTPTRVYRFARHGESLPAAVNLSFPAALRPSTAP